MSDVPRIPPSAPIPPTHPLRPTRESGREPRRQGPDRRPSPRRDGDRHGGEPRPETERTDIDTGPGVGTETDEREGDAGDEKPPRLPLIDLRV